MLTKLKILIVVLSLGIGLPLLYGVEGFFDELRSLPEDKKEKHFPVVMELPAEKEVEWFHVLGFNEVPSYGAVRKAWLPLIRDVHPDKNFDEQWTRTAAPLVNAAYQVVSKSKEMHQLQQRQVRMKAIFQFRLGREDANSPVSQLPLEAVWAIQTHLKKMDEEQE